MEEELEQPDKNDITPQKGKENITRRVAKTSRLIHDNADDISIVMLAISMLVAGLMIGMAICATSEHSWTAALLSLIPFFIAISSYIINRIVPEGAFKKELQKAFREFGEKTKEQAGKVKDSLRLSRP